MILSGMQLGVGQGNTILFFGIVVMVEYDVHKDRWNSIWYNRGLLDSVWYPVKLIFTVACWREAKGTHPVFQLHARTWTSGTSWIMCGF